MMAGGLAMLAAGAALAAYASSSAPVGEPGMGEDEALAVEIGQAQSRDYTALAGMLAGVGMLVALVSLGMNRRRGGAPARLKERPAAGAPG